MQTIGRAAALIAVVSFAAACSDNNDDNNNPLPDDTGVDAGSDTGVDTGDDDTGVDTGGDTGDDDPFVFSTTPTDSYTGIEDGIGQPAISTALLLDTESKTAYNNATPISGPFAQEILGNLAAIHAGLDDELIAIGLMPCTAIDPAGGEDCTGQDLGIPGLPGVTIAAAALPSDTIKILAPSATPGFPNGRVPADPVIDAILAGLLLDVSTTDDGVFTFVNGYEFTDADGNDVTLRLNPAANDLPLPNATDAANFPFLAPPHQP